MQTTECATGYHNDCNGDPISHDCECDCHGLARGIVTPIPDDPALSMDDALRKIGANVPEGAAPPRVVVERVIAERGRWGDPPKMLACRSCGFHNEPGASECVACNESAWDRPRDLA